MDVIKNKTYRCQIDGYTSEGAGVAHLNGQPIFIPYTAVGDQCDIRILKVKKNIAFGRVEELIVPSRHRITPVCPLAGTCGGCCFQHLSYEEELRAKEQKVRDALTRIGGLSADCLRGIIGSESVLHYRNKAQFPVGLDQRGEIVTGFYRPHSHDIVPTETCCIQSESINRIVFLVRDWMRKHQIPPYNYDTRRGTIRHIYVRTGEKSGECQLTLISATRKLPALSALIELLRQEVPSLTGILINHNQREDNVILGERTDVLWGEPVLEDRMFGYSFLLSPAAFYQVNHRQAERLYDCVLEFAALTNQETAVDLYCGVGTITLALAKHAKNVIGIEITPEAVENARQNAVRNGIANVKFLCADAGIAARRLAMEGVRPNVLVVDPPRKGLEPAARDAILRMQPSRIVYVSCAPATLARDVKELCSVGYKLETTQAFDLFPRTSHVECVVLLSYKKT